MSMIGACFGVLVEIESRQFLSCSLALYMGIIIVGEFVDTGKKVMLLVSG